MRFRSSYAPIQFTQIISSIACSKSPIPTPLHILNAECIFNSLRSYRLPGHCFSIAWVDYSVSYPDAPIMGYVKGVLDVLEAFLLRRRSISFRRSVRRRRFEGCRQIFDPVLDNTRTCGTQNIDVAHRVGKEQR